MVETKLAGFGANMPVPLGLRPAGAHFVMRLARCAHIAHRRHSEWTTTPDRKLN